MNVSELQKKIHTFAAFVDGALAPKPGKDSEPPAPESEADRAIRAVVMSGIQMLGELLMDIKRLADAAEKGATTLERIDRE